MTKLRRVPIGGWQRCVYEAASFESGGELQAARLLDAANGVEWWLRNDPVQFKIPTPVGSFEPDFVYRIRQGSANIMGILEIKGEIYWDGDGSEPRIKADTACAWVRRFGRQAPRNNGSLRLSWSKMPSKPNLLNPCFPMLSGMSPEKH